MKKIVKNFLKIIIGAIIAFFVTTIIGIGITFFQEPETYKIVIVGPASNSDLSITTFKKEFDNLWKQRKPTFGVNDGVEIKITTIGENCNSSSPSEIQEFVEQNVLNKLDGIIMVIGHFYSDHTMKALPVYLNQSPPIPVLCPMETNAQLNNLIEFFEKDGENSSPVYCFAPNDGQQAEDAAMFALKTLKEAKRSEVNAQYKFWVVRDVENPKYSKDLANLFIDNIQTDSSGQVVFLSQVDNLPEASTLLDFNFDCVFYAGFHKNGRILLNYINYIFHQQNENLDSSSLKKPLIILSDGCYETEIFNKGTFYNDFLGIYITTPYEDARKLASLTVDFVENNILDKRINNPSLSDKFFNPPFYKNLFKLDRTADARIAIQKVLQEINKTSDNYRVKGNKFFIRKLEFDSIGEIKYTTVK